MFGYITDKMMERCFGDEFYKFEKLATFCKNYKCDLLTSFDEFKSNIITIKSFCGHVSQISFNKFTKHKIGVYCDNCFQSMLHLHKTSTCFKCGTSFIPAHNTFLYCTTKCAQSRTRTDEIKTKIKTSVLKYRSQLIDTNDTDNVHKKRKRVTDNTNETLHNNFKRKKTVAYEIIKKTYEDNNCQLLTTEEEYIELKKTHSLKKIQFKIISSCGHASNKSLYYGLIESGTGKLCAHCTNTKMITTMKQNAKTIHGHCASFDTQKKAIDVIKKICKDKYIIKKTRDGCDSNIIAKPINSVDDSWLKIKIKSTDCESHCIKFKIDKVCDKSIVLMISVKTEEIWIFQPNELSVRTYYMGKYKWKYDKNLVTNIVEQFDTIYKKDIFNTTFDLANTPISTASKLEHLYIKKRETTIKYLDFCQNEVCGLSYNFKIGNLKVQEMTFSRYKNKKSYVAKLNKNMGRCFTQPYSAGDNDLYWLNINEHDEHFYVVPEHVLIENGYIQTTEQVGRKYLNVGANKSWLLKYQFSYKNINKSEEKERLIRLISSVSPENCLSVLQ